MTDPASIYEDYKHQLPKPSSYETLRVHTPRPQVQMKIHYPLEIEKKKPPETQYLSWEGGTPGCIIDHRIRRRLLTLKPPSECGVYAWEKRGHVVSWEREKAAEEAA